MNQLKNRELMIVVILLIASMSYGKPAEPNDSNLSDLISEMMAHQGDGARELKKQPVRLTDEQLRREPPEKVLSLLEPFEDYNSFSAQQLTFYYEIKIAHLHPTPQIRQRVNSSLVNALFDPNSRVGGDACNWLLSFVEQDFSEESKARILRAFLKKNNNICLIKICGAANLQTVSPQLKELLIDETAYMNDPNDRAPWYYRVGWYARLARARMGVKEDIDKCVGLIEQEIDNNKNWRLLDDLGYIRQPEAIESLKKYFLSDLRLLPTNPGMDGEPYSHYLMTILDDNLSNFPVKKDEIAKRARHYKQEEIEICRKWMSEQKEWKIIR